MTDSSSSVLRGLRVLIVEDHKDAAHSLDLLLTLLGCDTCVAHNAQDALTLHREFQPAAVLLDIGLPGMNGWELAKSLRGPGAHPLTIIAISGFGTIADRERSREAGIDVHLLKPAQPKLIESLLKGVAARVQATEGVRPTDRVERGGNLSRLVAYVRNYVGSQVRDLELVATPEGFCLRGKADSVKAKQLAEEALFRIAPQPIVGNEIQVV